MRQSNGTEALARVRELRRSATSAERLLWRHLRNRRLDGFKFRRQSWIGPFIVDLLCVEAGLVIEADGGQHADQIDYDARRDAYLATKGYQVIRFWNKDIEGNIDGVLEAIRQALIERVPSPSRAARGSLPLPVGEGH